MELTEKLSDNLICNWIITKPRIKLKKNNIISIAFFLRKDTDNTANLKYINGIKYIISNFETIKLYRLRIYFDISARDILYNILEETNKKTRDKVELFEYSIPLLKDGEIYHVGYIGTLLRFLPLFDTPIHKTDKCFILDIDNSIYNFTKKITDICNKKKINVFYRSRNGYSLSNRILCMSDNIIIENPIIASLIYQSKINIPYKILSTFFEDIYIKNNNSILKDCNINKYEYGVDEIFINKYYLNYIYNNNIYIAKVLFFYYNIYNTIIAYFGLIKTIKDLNYYINFLNLFFNLLKINVKINNIQKHLKINFLINKIKQNIKYNKTEIEAKLNILLKNDTSVKENILKFLLDYNDNNSNNFKLFIKFIYNDICYINNTKILMVPLLKNKNNIKKIYINLK
jgi:hypothetical protein